MSLTVLVVAYGSPEPLRAALAPLSGYDVIVVDNSSDPLVADVCVGVSYVDAGGNRGFGAGVNLGLQHVRERGGGHVLLLNPDAVVQPDAIEQLLRTLAGSRVGAVAPRQVSPAGAEQRVTWPFPAPASAWREALMIPGGPRTGFLTGSVLLLHADALEQVGPFDEGFFLYAEETDWQRRASLAGWQLVYEPGATAVHEGAGTSTHAERREALFHAGQETYIRKWFGTSGWRSYRLAVLVGSAIRAVLLRGDAGRAARGRVALYARGPRRVATTRGWLPATPPTQRITT